MLELVSRLCVGIGLLWVLLVVSVGLLSGLDKPAAWAPLLDAVLGADLRRGLYLGLTLVVVPIGMLTILLDVLRDPGPLWLKLAVPGAFAAVYALFLAAALPETGQPLLLGADPLATGLLPGVQLSRDPNDAGSWLIRCGAGLLVLAGLPGALGLVAGLLAGGAGRR